jgi:SAM-dependent methyltransferase
MKCPICQCEEFIDFRGREKTKCIQCGSLERTRVVRMLLEKVIKLAPGMKVLHFAPEAQLSPYVHSIVGDNYDCHDLFPEGYQHAPVEVTTFDLCKDVFDLPDNHYDLVMHNHVLEHVPCNYTIVLQQLQRSVKPGGHQMFSMPISPGYYREDIDPEVDKATRTELYMQSDHVRRFGRKDIEQTIGMIFGIKSDYSLLQYFAPEELLEANVRRHWWVVSGAAPFVIPKA